MKSKKTIEQGKMFLINYHKRAEKEREELKKTLTEGIIQKSSNPIEVHEYLSSWIGKLKEKDNIITVLNEKIELINYVLEEELD